MCNKYTHWHAFKQAVKDSPWGQDADGAVEEDVAGSWPVNPGLPASSAKIFMSAQQVSWLGLDFHGHFDWPAIAAFLAQEDAALKLESVCRQTKWRRMLGKASGSVPQFTCTFTGARGTVAGPLGSHLLLATVNLVAWGYEDKVVLLDAATLERQAEAANAGPVRTKHQQETEVARAIKSMRQSYTKFLAAQPGKEVLEQRRLLEDDALDKAWEQGP